MDIITGYTGSPHVTAEQDRDINIGIFGNESYVLQTGSQLTAEVSSNNEIKVRDVLHRLKRTHTILSPLQMDHRE